jgi:DNA invertase Pin-like site-specific DNA recombinase
MMIDTVTTDRSINDRPTLLSSKITQGHLQLGAALYVRQSTSAQLREHQESTARQYAMKDRLIAFGWSEQAVIVIDDDLGVSGSGKADRPGFRRLLKLVTDQQVGIVLGLEMSRLARNSKDWSDLFEVCAIFDTLIADEDGVFHPLDPNDRLVLGLKGIISEMELHTMKVRLERGRLSKAQRGELFHDVPVGYILDDQKLPQLDPDESARHVMKLFFDRFASLGSSNALFHHLVEHDIKLPFRNRRRDKVGQIDWRLASKTAVYELLKHPLYAGAYGYGRKKKYRCNTSKSSEKKYLPPDQWKVLIQDRYPAYISWQQYENNQQRLRDNDTREDHTGPVRGGSALLGGRLRCAHCGRRMSVSYPRNGHAIYSCSRHRTVAAANPCHSSIRCETLDRFVSSKLLEALGPAGVELSLQVIEDESVRREQLDTLHAQRVEQARYAADLTERRYKQVDPANRLVASRLEKEWEESLVKLDAAKEELRQLRHQQPVALSEPQRAELRHACADIASLWRDQASIPERKEIVRLLLQRIEVDVQNNSERVSLRLHWSGGFESCYDITRGVMKFHQLESYAQLIERVRELAIAGKRSPQIASILAQEGFLSPRHAAPISAMMVQKLILEHPPLRKQLIDPKLTANQWRAADLATQLGLPEKRIKDWVTRGWVTAVQRPFGRTWVIYADAEELNRLQQLARSQSGQGRPRPPNELRTPKPLPR